MFGWIGLLDRACARSTDKDAPMPSKDKALMHLDPFVTVEEVRDYNIYVHQPEELLWAPPENVKGSDQERYETSVALATSGDEDGFAALDEKDATVYSVHVEKARSSRLSILPYPLPPNLSLMA